jgi:pimeloyl-ACP methyl ester carboxylesterase
MNERPVFVPFRGDSLAATITLPEEEPRGLIGLFQGGGGAPRSHRHAVWTRAARRLAERGFAIVRLDWRGIGDSSGEALFRLREPPSDQAVAVMRFAMDATGLRRFGVAGNCLGARAALGVAAAVPGCDSVALIMLKPLAGNQTPASARNRRSARRRLTRALTRFPALDRVFRTWRARRQWRRRTPLLDQLVGAARSGSILMMEDHVATKLEPAMRSLERRQGLRPIELRDLPTDMVRVFDDLGRQDLLIGTLVDWFDRTMLSRGEAGWDPLGAIEQVPR